jgi:hypothetical protein
MNDPRPGTPHGHGNRLSGHFYRVVRRGPGAQPAIREPADLDELRNAVRTQLEGLEPGAFRLQSNAVTITGAHDGDEVTVTVQHFVAQPTDVWAAASGGPTTDSSAWSDTVAQEAHRLGWHVPGLHQETDDA